MCEEFASVGKVQHNVELGWGLEGIVHGDLKIDYNTLEQGYVQETIPKEVKFKKQTN